MSRTKFMINHVVLTCKQIYIGRHHFKEKSNLIYSYKLILKLVVIIFEDNPFLFSPIGEKLTRNRNLFFCKEKNFLLSEVKLNLLISHCFYLYLTKKFKMIFNIFYGEGSHLKHDKKTQRKNDMNFQSHSVNLMKLNCLSAMESPQGDLLKQCNKKGEPSNIVFCSF